MHAFDEQTSTNAFTRRLLVTSGPTHEPIDSVRFLGNRSSGRLGVALADEAARRGWDVTILLGPVQVLPTDSSVRVQRFRTAADLQGLLRAEAPLARVVIMAAAVSDYRPREGPSQGKIKREGDGLRLDLEATPDLLAQIARDRPQGQFIVGFALEPRERMLASAGDKLARKGVDMIVANPLETMDSPSIEAVVLDRHAGRYSTDGAISKQDFGAWLLTLIEQAAREGARR